MNPAKTANSPGIIRPFWRHSNQNWARPAPANREAIGDRRLGAGFVSPKAPRAVPARRDRGAEIRAGSPRRSRAIAARKMKNEVPINSAKKEKSADVTAGHMTLGSKNPPP